MPLKKKGKKKAKSKAAGGTALDPSAVLTGGTQTDFVAKASKKKLTKGKKELNALEKKCDELRVSAPRFDEFIKRLDSWLKNNQDKAVGIFRKLDEEGEGFITFDIFKAGLRDLSVPCSDVELHTLCQLLDVSEEDDPEVHEVNFMDLREGLKNAREEREANLEEADIRPALYETKRNVAHCPGCKMPTWDGEPYREQFPRYTEVLFRMVSFDGFEKHPGHFNRILPSYTTVLGLMQIINDVTGIASSTLSIFGDKSRSREAMLPPNESLEECGFSGGSFDQPAELLLYYDYKAEFSDCPILMCDHYFGNKVKPYNR